MRIFIGGLLTETNTFSPFPTGRSAFEEYGIDRQVSRRESLVSGPMTHWRTRAEADGHELVESICPFAQPAGMTVRKVYEELRDMILDDLREGGAFDVVLLFLHGAMVADGYDDCEGDLLGRVRTLQPDAVIGAVLDPHCHLTDRMVEQADLIIPAKEYPHIDFTERAAELYTLAVGTAEGRIAPVAAFLDTAMVGFYPTFDGPMKDVVAELRAAEAREGILSVNLAHGFPWADVAELGTRVLVYSDGDPELAAAEAARIGRLIYDQRHALLPAMPDLDASLDRQRGLNGRVVLGDFADNPGGGGPGDSTFVLRALLERRISNAVVGGIWDPFVAQMAADAGVGARLSIRLGGKCGPASGDPLDLDVEVMACLEEHSQSVFGQRQPLGRSAWLRADGIDILVCSIRTQIFDPDAFTGLGIDLDNRRLVIVKSSNHYTAGFGPDADHLWHVATPGTLGLDFGNMPYTKRGTIFFPRVDDPWAEAGEPAPRIKMGRGSALAPNEAAAGAA